MSGGVGTEESYKGYQRALRKLFKPQAGPATCPGDCFLLRRLLSNGSNVNFCARGGGKDASSYSTAISRGFTYRETRC